MEAIENPGLSTVVDIITKEVTKALQKCISHDIIIENQQTWKHLSNIPQIKKLIEKNVELQTELNVFNVQQNNINQNNYLNTQPCKLNMEKIEMKKEIEHLRQRNTMLQHKIILNNENNKRILSQEKIINTQKEWLLKLRAQVNELKKPLTINTNLNSNKISLEVEELETKKDDVEQAIQDSNAFYAKMKPKFRTKDKKENTVLNNTISIEANTELDLDDTTTESSDDDDSDDDSGNDLMLEHWEREKQKLSNMEETFVHSLIHLETKDDSPTNISDGNTIKIPWETINTEQTPNNDDEA